jgi:hypothetical protein
MSELSYGSVELSYVKTKTFYQEPVFTGADGSGDYLYTKFRISVEGVFNSSLPPAAIAQFPGDATPAGLMARIRQLLWQPREQLVYSVNGVVLLSSPQQSAIANQMVQRKTDANNGPIVNDVNVTALTENTFRIDFDVTTWLQDCSAATVLGGSGPKFISNRFTTDFDIDQHQYVTITTRGTVFTRADVNVNPDSLRGAIAPTLTTGAVAERSHFGVLESGLAVTYEFVDREVFRVPPGNALTPVYEASGSYMLSSPLGSLPHAELQLKLIGKKTTSTQRLAQLALLLAVKKISGRSKLPSPNLDNSNGFILDYAAIKQSWGENAVEVVMRCRLPLPKIARGGVPDPLFGIANNGWYDPGQDTYPNNLSLKNRPGPVPLLYGTAALQSNLAWLRDPCDIHTTRGPNGADIGVAVARGLTPLPDSNAPVRTIKQP